MKRYIRDDKLRAYQAEVRAEVERIGALAPRDGFAIYTIHDPTEDDPFHFHKEGLPIYVGQSKQLKQRANSHMKDGGGGSYDDTLKGDRLKLIMDSYAVPVFKIIDIAPSHLTSLIAETIWARRHVWYGYNLANRWAEHRNAERPKGLNSVPLSRLHRFTVADAVEDDISFSLNCPQCGVRQPLDLAAMEPEVKLSTIRSMRLTCSAGHKLIPRIAKPDAATWRWASYTPSPMPPRLREL